MMANPYVKLEPKTRYGRLVIVGSADSITIKGKQYGQYKVRCDCGETKVVLAKNLRNGHTKSCGCLRRETTSKRNTTHGETTANLWSKEYVSWAGMIARCENPNHKHWQHYGGRGIQVCARWRHGDGRITGVECFLLDMGRKPTPWHSIDRYPNNDGNYEPTNCRWATKAEQVNNRRPKRSAK